MEFRNRRITVMGLGHFGGGVGAARWLARQGAIVTVTDLADETVLAESLKKLGDVPIAKFHLGGHRDEAFREADLVVVNPAVRPGNPFLKIAQDAGVLIRCELELFMNACPAKAIGVTGSNGKSTTAAMIAEILRRTGFQPVEEEPRKRQVGNLSQGNVWLGGNLGGSLLEHLDDIRPNDWTVLEISSFQLWHFSPEVKMPHIAVVTGCTANHLDWHGTFAEYAAAKQKLLRGQGENDFAVLNAFDAETAGWSRFAKGKLLKPYSAERIARIPLSTPGEHNRANAALAASAASAAGCTEEKIEGGLADFRGLPQRMQFVEKIDGRSFYDDSASTTPESTIAAIKTFDKPVWLLAGGRNKGFDFSALASAVARYARGAAFFGSCRDELEKETKALRTGFPCAAYENLSEALPWCFDNSHPGEAIVLSPGCASTDQFRNFRHRGETFVEMVKKMSKRES